MLAGHAISGCRALLRGRAGRRGRVDATSRSAGAPRRRRRRAARARAGAARDAAARRARDSGRGARRVGALASERGQARSHGARQARFQRDRLHVGRDRRRLPDHARRRDRRRQAAAPGGQARSGRSRRR